MKKRAYSQTIETKSVAFQTHYTLGASVETSLLCDRALRAPEGWVVDARTRPSCFRRFRKRHALYAIHPAHGGTGATEWAKVPRLGTLVVRKGCVGVRRKQAAVEVRDASLVVQRGDLIRLVERETEAELVPHAPPCRCSEVLSVLASGRAFDMTGEYRRRGWIVEKYPTERTCVVECERRDCRVRFGVCDVCGWTVVAHEKASLQLHEHLKRSHAPTKRVQKSARERSAEGKRRAPPPTGDDGEARHDEERAANKKRGPGSRKRSGSRSDLRDPLRMLSDAAHAQREVDAVGGGPCSAPGCYKRGCPTPDGVQLLCCDGEGCDREYHLTGGCAGVTEPPPGEWLCPECRGKETKGT